jgi:hypothetical protein
MVAGEPPQLGPHRTADRALQSAAVRPRPCWCGRKARPRPGPGPEVPARPGWAWARSPQLGRCALYNRGVHEPRGQTNGRRPPTRKPTGQLPPRPQGNVFSVCIVRMRRRPENTRIFSVLESAGERMVHHDRLETRYAKAWRNVLSGEAYRVARGVEGGEAYRDVQAYRNPPWYLQKRAYLQRYL